jgi:hypothetical protein
MNTSMFLVPRSGFVFAVRVRGSEFDVLGSKFVPVGGEQGTSNLARGTLKPNQHTNRESGTRNLEPERL